MHYLRNSEVARLYNVSQTAVGKWVEQAKLGKLDLKLIERDGKSYIASSTHNRDMIEQIVQERKKYLNTRSHKVIKPSDEFYANFSPEQIRDIAENIEIHRDIPRQYNYLGVGATSWDAHIRKLYPERNHTPPDAELINLNLSYIDHLIAGFDSVNVIDIGPGNGYPIRELLKYLKSKEKLARYIAVDISPEMLAIAEGNVNQWFGDSVVTFSDIRDVSHERFGELLAKEYLGDRAPMTLNLVMMIGGTLGNFTNADDVLRTIYHSLGCGDIFLYTLKLGIEANKLLFNFSTDRNGLPSMHNVVYKMLNITEDLYDVESGYDEAKNWRYIRTRFRTAISIEFQLPGGIRRVDIPKDDSILVWHYRHQTALQVVEQFTQNGFNVIQASQTPDHEFLLVICDIKSDR